MAFPPTSAPLARALVDREYNDPTPVQLAVMEAEAADRDLLVSAQTGSGKTVAYGLAFASTLLGVDEYLPRADGPLALVVAPTRELALQVHRELTWLYEHAGARVVSCVGGMDPKSEARQLNIGAHIVVGTPGRLRDHLERGRLRIGDLKVVVLDEADEMLDLGFREDLEFILEATPEERRTLLFSATLPKEIVSLAKKFQRDAVRIQAGGGERGHADIEYRAITIAPRDVEHVVVNVLRFVEAPSAIVFCNTRESVRHLHAILSERGFSAVSLSGELSQSERNHALQALRDGRARVCVATDVAARGIDLPNLGLVIHADLPHDPEVLQHRSGRTGRAGRKGVSVLLIPHSRRRKAEILLRNARITPNWLAAPSADDIRKLDHERLMHSTMFDGENSEDDLVMAKALLAERSAEDIALALARVYRSQLPAAEDVIDAGPSPRDTRDNGRNDRNDRGARGESEGRNRRDREPREDRAPRPPRKTSGPAMPGGSVWFRLNVGSAKNADPRWLLPMICRQGGVTKREIGAIRIFEHETRVEVAGVASDGFLEAVRQVPKGEVRIEPMKPGAEQQEPTAADRMKDDAPQAKAPREDRSQREERPQREEHAPREERTHENKAPAKKKWEPRDRPVFIAEPDTRPDGSQADGGKERYKPKHEGKPKYENKGKPEGKSKYEGKPKFEGKPKYEGKPKFEGKPKYEGKPKFEGKPKTEGTRPDRGDARDPSARLSFSDRPKTAGKPAFKGKPKFAGKPGAKVGGKPDYSKSKGKGGPRG
ncbi:MAG: DEAD/DEAH box helicase [Parvibaculum sp.]|nr:DEAD/DEAH box helicase [Parvibaculum sp.]